MGSGLLHKVNRDTMSFATKLSHIVYSDGTPADIMKHPVASGKDSFPGVLAVKRVHGIPTVFPHDSGDVSASEDLLQTVYDHGPVQVGSDVAGTPFIRQSCEFRAVSCNASPGLIPL